MGDSINHPAIGFEDGRYPVRDCIICGAEIGYEVVESKPYFDANCNCILHRSPLEPRTNAEFAKFLGRPMTEDQEKMDSVLVHRPAADEAIHSICSRYLLLTEDKAGLLEILEGYIQQYNLRQS